MKTEPDLVLEGIEASDLLEFGERTGEMPTVVARKPQAGRFGSQELLSVLLPYVPAVLSFLAVYLARKQASSRDDQVAEMERRPDGTIVVRMRRTIAAQSSEPADPKLVNDWLKRLKDLMPSQSTGNDG